MPVFGKGKTTRVYPAEEGLGGIKDELLLTRGPLLGELRPVYGSDGGVFLRERPDLRSLLRV